MSDSLRPTQLICPECRHVIRLDIPRVSYITYTCDVSEATIEESLLAESKTVTKNEPPSSS